MKRVIIYLISILTITIGLGYAKPVEALYIVAPSDVSISYISDTSIKLNYKTNNTNSNYKVQIFNSTLGKLYTTEVNTTSYTVTGLEFGKTYNFLLRVYYKTSTATYKSNWTNAVSATPKADAPVINSITSGDKSVTLNYKVTGSPKGVQIYNSNTKKVIDTTNLSTYKVTGLTNGTTYKFLIRNYYDNSAYGPWSIVKEGTPKVSGTTGSSSNNFQTAYKSPTKISGKYKHAGCGVKDGAGLRNYSSSKNWTVVIRAKNADKAELIAQKAYIGAKNSHILYSKKKATTYYEKLKNVNWEPSKVNKKCYCSCGTFVTASVNAAFKKRLIHPNTRSNDLASRLKKTGEFSVYSGSTGKKMAKSISKLKRGDIIMSKNNSGYHARIII